MTPISIKFTIRNREDYANVLRHLASNGRSLLGDNAIVPESLERLADLVPHDGAEMSALADDILTHERTVS